MEPTSEPLKLNALTRRQRRVLGTLIEKGMTTPDQYPLTLKSATTGCNQKNNRDPVTNYDEDMVYQALDELREMGLVAFVHPDSGRTERYRHYVRHRLTLSEAQIAILTELLLRGHQQMGELRTRASRMVPIDSLETLRAEVEGLMKLGYVRSNGPLERRGVEVDHALYPAGENHDALPALAADTSEPAAASPVRAPAASSASTSYAPAATPANGRVEQLEGQVRELRDLVETLRGELDDVRSTVDSLRQQLGG